MSQRLTDIQKGMIIGLKKSGHSGWPIQQKLKDQRIKVPIRMINRIYSDFQKRGDDGHTENRVRMRILNQEQKQKIRVVVLRNKSLSINDIQKSKQLNPTQVSTSTAYNTLKRLDLVTRVAPTKPLISERILILIDYGQLKAQFWQQYFLVEVFASKKLKTDQILFNILPFQNKNLVDKGYLEGHKFQHDKEIVQTSKKVKEYLAEEAIKVLNWV